MLEAAVAESRCPAWASFAWAAVATEGCQRAHSVVRSVVHSQCRSWLVRRWLQALAEGENDENMVGKCSQCWAFQVGQCAVSLVVCCLGSCLCPAAERLQLQ